MRFSEREGYVKKNIQYESLDLPTRNRLWNLITHIIQASFPDRRQAYKLVWAKWLKKTVDQIPKKRLLKSEGLWETGQERNDPTYEKELDDFHYKLRDIFLQSKWYHAFDLLEILAEEEEKEGSVKFFTKKCNKIFEEEVVSYRFIKSKIVPITDKVILDEIEKALDIDVDSVRKQLETALDLLTDREKPVYRKSMNEAISAVEGYCKLLVNNSSAKLKDALNRMEVITGVKLHPKLKAAYRNLYGYSSDAGGIRHELKDGDIEVDFYDAKYFLVVCSAFINYLKGKTQTLES